MPAKLFDANFYRALNPDLAGLTDEQASSHFFTYGLSEGRMFSPFVNLQFYQARNPDLAAAGLTTNQQLFQHLQDFGVAEGRVFSSFVDLNFYLANNPDVSQAFGGDRFQALQHLALYGLEEKRQFSPFFDPNYYQANNPDLVTAGLNQTQLLQHLQMYGLQEGRVFSPTLDINYYQALNPDLGAAGLDNRGAYEHFQRYGLAEGRISSPSFNVQVYLANNPDLGTAGFNCQQAYEHYLLFGQGEGRPGSDYAGDSLASARLAGLGTTPNSITDFVGISDTADWYQFTLGRAGEWQRSLNVQSGAVTLQMAQDSNSNGAIEQGEILQSFTATPAITLSEDGGILEAGSYYVQIAPDNAETNTNYALSLSLNPSPLLANNTGLTLTSGSTKIIGNDQLRVVDADTDATQLIYTLKDAPLNGSFQLNGLVLNANQTFTQDDINQGRVSYQSDSGNASSDRFNFSVTDGTTTLNSSFNLSIGRDPYLVKDINPGLGQWPYGFLINAVNVNGTLYFSASSPEQGLWKSDGTEAGTTLVKQNAYPSANVNGLLYFFSSGLWKSDGTEAGKTFIKAVGGNAFTSAQFKTNVAVIGNTFYFPAHDTIHGPELWKSDGTPEGTLVVTDINPGNFGSFAPAIFTNINDTLYFSAYSSGSGEALWKSDGTGEGTVLLKQGVWPVSNLSFANVNGTLYFMANDRVHGTELWKSDGTPEGTVLVDINPGAIGSLSPGIFKFLNINDTLYFEANDGVHGKELWRSDGTSEGTFLVKDINPGAASSSPSYLTAINDTLYFSSNDGVHGTELWQSNGTSEGTVLVKDINPGVDSSNPQNLVNFDGSLYFGADDSVYGAELWKSDGTTLGTTLVEDINPGVNSSQPSSFSGYNFVQSDNKLFFGADDGVHGTELWAIESSVVAGQG
ncbi:MAG: hypothetical protein KME12_00335 [Trichocoleus desertorum ATA4-8-CV12]|jgi:ELWxxDGT repeat protein|nr:hypothetical protein [Trichocoleus desertorum ATA4-8-CV12]